MQGEPEGQHREDPPPAWLAVHHANPNEVCGEQGRWCTTPSHCNPTGVLLLEFNFKKEE